MNKPVILIIEDDLDVAEMLYAYFRVQDYYVLVANWGKDGIDLCRAKNPDIVILDIRLPDIDGYEVAQHLRSDWKTKNIPIIFLTEKRGKSSRIQGLELGADDYITKPFDIQELKLRVRNSLQRSMLGSVTNPVTGLPEGATVDDQLTECLGSESWAILIISLKNLEQFRDVYGFVASDDVLRAVSLMVQNAISKFGNIDDFIGHTNSTDFMVVTKPDVIAELKKYIIKILEQSFEYFYPLKDRHTTKIRPDRLTVKLTSTLPSQGPYHNLDNLKKNLLQD